MSYMVNRAYSVSMQAHKKNGEEVLSISCRSFSDGRVISMGIDHQKNPKEALDEMLLKADREFSGSNDDDILTCIGKHWWEYGNTLYSYSRDIGGEVSDMALSLLEFYVQNFSVNMLFFLSGLTEVDAAVVRAVLGGGSIPSDHIYFIELKEASRFYRLIDGRRVV